MSVASWSAAYPAAMEHKLRTIRRRHLALAIARASLLAILALLMSMLAAMCLDWWFRLNEHTARVSLTVTALGLTAATWLWSGVRPVKRALELRRAARHADRVFPQLEDRWTTVAHFAEAVT